MPLTFGIDNLSCLSPGVVDNYQVLQIMENLVRIDKNKSGYLLENLVNNFVLVYKLITSEN